MMRGGRSITTAVMAIVAFTVAAAPAAAQFSSNAYDFLKAVKERDGNKVQDLLNKPSSTTVLTRDDATGDTALHIVVKHRDLVWTQYMIAKGVPIDARDRNGNTPLFDAAQLGFIDGEQLLLQVGASVDLANNRGETPLIAATQAHDIGSVRLLLQSGANPKETDHVAGMSAIDYATRDNRSAQILTLLKSAKPVVHKDVAGPSIN
jgi:uncharacterized protein